MYTFSSLLAAGGAALVLTISAPAVAHADPVTGRVIGGGIQAPLRKPRPVEIPLPSRPISIVPPKIKAQQDATTVAIKRLGKDAVSEAVKGAACAALNADFDYAADHHLWADLITDRLPMWLRERAVDNDDVMTLVLSAVDEVAKPLSGLSSHWTGAIYVAAC